MKVTKEMVHEELRPVFNIFAFLTFLSKRTWFIKLGNALSRLLMHGNNIPGLDCQERFIPSSDGSWNIRTRIYRPGGNDDPLPLLLYIHGGGYLSGSPESNRRVIEKFIEARPCVIIAPDYRKSLTAPYPAGFNDCYDTLLWAMDNAAELVIRADRAIVAGHSAGGGLTAAVTLKARDTRDVDIAFQMPIYPMIDDRQPFDPDREIQVPVWDTDMNRIGWGAYLSGLQATGAEIPAYAAPARNDDYIGFPPTITFVGELEPFYWETVAYVQALRKAGVDVAFKQYERCFHAFEFLSKSSVGRDAIRFTFDTYAQFYDKYVLSPQSVEGAN